MLVYKIEIRQGLKNCYPVIPDSYKFSCRAKISFSFAQWVTAGKLSSNKIKKKEFRCPGQAKFEGCFSKGQARIQVFFSSLVESHPLSNGKFCIYH